ncbi:MAG: CocE/NonD family hydrolase, partial [Nannocystaceae bacterium]|nr:CocE/NonD family hydrolase [Nannocystaceae bacterium]
MRIDDVGFLRISAACFLVGVLGCQDPAASGSDSDSDTDTDTNTPSTSGSTIGGAGSSSSGDVDDSSADSTGGDPGTAEFEVRESVEQLHVTKTAPGTSLTLYDASGAEVQTGTTDDLGSLIYRLVEPAEGYVIRETDNPDIYTRDLRVMSVDNSLPDPSFYAQQVLHPGFSYIETRDGTRLSIFVSLPGPPEDGPYPTLVNYSGYSPSRPGSPLDLGDIPVEGLCPDYPVLCDAPDHPSGLIGGILGYATVGVNMRGTGCSGGAYDFFETLQNLDGYDIVETVASQPWVKGNKVGLAGLSYPGISQAFVASVRPPSLAAITPMSVIADGQSILVPGGILNDGFAIEWADRVLSRAVPYGQGWEEGVIAGGDPYCDDNQLLHGQAVDLIAKAYENPFYDPEVADPLNLNLRAPNIEVPVFLTGQWQDEQTGPGFAGLLDKFSGSPTVRLTALNGVHPDGYAPQTLVEWNNFLSFYVREEIPRIDPELRVLAPLMFEALLGAQIEFPEDRFADYDNFEDALAAYEAEQDLRIIFESGASANAEIGAPDGTWEASFDQWPPEETEALRLYFHADGMMRADPPADDDTASIFEHDPDEGQRTTLAPGSDEWDLLPEYNWPLPEQGRGIVFNSEALAEDTVMVGHGSIDLWIRSTADDADIEVTVSELRPDGQEMYVQSGWQRASLRALSPEATELRPVKTFLEEDVEPLPADEWTLVRVELMAFGHVFRESSQIRLIVDTPGASRTGWRFALQELPAGTTHSVAHSAMNPSSVVLPLIPVSYTHLT